MSRQAARPRCAALDCRRIVQANGRCKYHQDWAPGWNPPQPEPGDRSLAPRGKTRNRQRELNGERRQAENLTASLLGLGHDPEFIEQVVELHIQRRRESFDRAHDGLS